MAGKDITKSLTMASLTDSAENVTDKILFDKITEDTLSPVLVMIPMFLPTN